MSSFNGQYMTCGKMQKTHALREAALPRLGWKRAGDYWINPRSGRRYDTFGAINIEDLRGTFRREWMAAYTAKRPVRNRRRERERRELAARNGSQASSLTRPTGFQPVVSTP